MTVSCDLEVSPGLCVLTLLENSTSQILALSGLTERDTPA